MLERFKKAQVSSYAGFETALSEIRAGQKQSHWIWYIFPQLAGLGKSSTSQMYAIQTKAEAKQYLSDTLLCSRLLAVTSAVAERVRNGVTLEVLMNGSLDAAKLVSSLTLWRQIAQECYSAGGIEAHCQLAKLADEILTAAESQGYMACQFTLSKISVP